MNPSIIARDLNLKDSVANEVTGKDGGPVTTYDIPKGTDPKEASRMYEEFIKGGK